MKQNRSEGNIFPKVLVLALGLPLVMGLLAACGSEKKGGVQQPQQARQPAATTTGTSVTSTAGRSTTATTTSGKPAAGATRTLNGKPKFDPPEDHTKNKHGFMHKPGAKKESATCKECHGPELKGGDGPSCYTCHDKKWN